MAAPLTRPARRATLRPGQRSAVAAFLVPFFFLFAIVLLAPIGYAVWMSLFQERSSGLGFGGTERIFSGFGNYTKVLGDQDFTGAFLHVALYCAFYIPVMIGAALALALLIDSAAARAKRFVQLAVFMPHAVPGMIAAIVWVYLYTPGLSPILDWIQGAGGSWDFFSNGHVLSSMVNVAAWQWTGYNMIIFYAALQAVPREVIEAAIVDGAGELRTALQIKLPMIRSAVTLTLLFTCVGVVQIFNEPKILGERAPGLGSMWSPMMYIYRVTFERHDYGLAAAASLILALVAGLLSFVVTWIGNRGKTA
ncbi:carbohydrate ABC transporter permease [Streptomyces sp. NPDC058430]|uniref:carbohydrate ABC transporter permease n=1 Tax=unclassified Streptomyces TaxID=2593676 RepID=UPI002256B473|nr:sugar ABC transporter permease [Streptomyces sp. NBC_00063]MCX5441487.1 sugar ABC transporter permease [Streptomyces sp. NBC_00063]